MKSLSDIDFIVAQIFSPVKKNFKKIGWRVKKFLFYKFFLCGITMSKIVFFGK